MIVVLPFCGTDLQLALKNLEWAIELDGEVEHPCLLSCDQNAPCDEIRALAERYFSEVGSFVYDVWHGPENWPQPQNNAFSKTCLHIYKMGCDPNYKMYTGIKEPWLWWEPDATPLCPGWVDQIEQAHLSGGKPFTGFLNPKIGAMNRRNWNGVSVYPWDVIAYVHQMVQFHKAPWDVGATPLVLPHLKVANDVFWHKWGYEKDEGGVEKEAVTFRTMADVARWVPPGRALWHRCKDGSLIDRLREQRNEGLKHESDRVPEQQIPDGAEPELGKKPDRPGVVRRPGVRTTGKRTPVARRSKKSYFRRVLAKPGVPVRPSPYASDDNDGWTKRDPGEFKGRVPAARPEVTRPNLENLSDTVIEEGVEGED